MDIQNKKADIGTAFSVKGKAFSTKATIYIQRLFHKFGFKATFGRGDVIELLN